MNEVLTALKVASTELGAAFARRALFWLVVGAMLIVAFGFGLAAGWIVLSEIYGSMTASLIIAGLLAGIALIALVVDNLVRRRRRKKHTHRAASSQQPTLAPLLAQTFVAAMNAGQSMNARRR